MFQTCFPYISSIDNDYEQEFAEEWEAFGAVYITKELEPEHPDTLRVVQNLDLLYHDHGKLDEAETMLKKALARFEKMEILEDEAILGTYCVLGVLYKQSFRSAEAVMVFQRATTREAARPRGSSNAKLSIRQWRC
jgi:tetratricopeptide (TPR) repeat protein